MGDDGEGTSGDSWEGRPPTGPSSTATANRCPCVPAADGCLSLFRCGCSSRSSRSSTSRSSTSRSDFPLMPRLLPLLCRWRPLSLPKRSSTRPAAVSMEASACAIVGGRSAGPAAAESTAAKLEHLPAVAGETHSPAAAVGCVLAARPLAAASWLKRRSAVGPAHDGLGAELPAKHEAARERPSPLGSSRAEAERTARTRAADEAFAALTAACGVVEALSGRPGVRRQPPHVACVGHESDGGEPEQAAMSALVSSREQLPAGTHGGWARGAAGWLARARSLRCAVSSSV